jgi:bifunctional DNase/RNase
MVEVKIEAILFDMSSNSPVVLLKDKEGKKFLPIWIGPFEANAIQMELEGEKPIRPLTHDLLKNILEELNAEVVKISICDLQDNIYYASITLKVNGRIVEIDSRPSDAIALAVRTKSPIFAEDWILKEIKEEAPEDERESFRKFLEGLSPEDFKYKH